ncbi:MAG: hypothetical protein Q9166_007913, partial [cf. Caloplaca sp. 2 TL-2023]
ERLSKRIGDRLAAVVLEKIEDSELASNQTFAMLRNESSTGVVANSEHAGGPGGM